MTFSDSFESFLRSLASTSEVKYRARVEHFLHYCAVEGFEINPSTVQDYMEELYEKYMASTLWSIFAILKAYFQADYHVDLQNELPGVVRLLKQWEKTEETSQSKVNQPQLIYLILYRSLQKSNWKPSFKKVQILPQAFNAK